MGIAVDVVVKALTLMPPMLHAIMVAIRGNDGDIAIVFTIFAMKRGLFLANDRRGGFRRGCGCWLRFIRCFDLMIIFFFSVCACAVW